MKTIWAKEMKSTWISFLIWTIAVGGMGFVCILLYSSMEDSMQEMADSFASMGAFADAFGMSTLSIATLTGYFATEIGTIHGLGSGMFAAAMATTMISKEEAGHSAEFLLALPVSRGKAVGAKICAIITQILLFHIICGASYAGGFLLLGEEMMMKEFLTFMGLQILMNFEIAGICLLISAGSRENRIGIGMGVALVLYLFDLMARIVPALEDYAMVSPYSFANASEIFVGKDMNYSAIGLGIVVIVACVAGGYTWYRTRDLAS